MTDTPKAVDDFIRHYAGVTDDAQRARLLARVKMSASDLAPDAAFEPDVRSLRDYLAMEIEIPPSLVWPTIAVRGEITTTLGRAGKGKRQRANSRLLTPTGFERFGDAYVGQAVIDPDGGVAHVTGVYPHGVQSVYRVTFTDGAQVVCGPEHLWLVKKWNNTKDRRLPLQEIMDEGLRNARGDSLWYVPMTEPVEFQSEPLAVQPYILGVLLGDGGISNGNVNWTACDDQIAVEIEARLPETCSLRKCGQHPLRTRILGPAQGSPNPIAQGLRALGLWGATSHTKFIPEAALCASLPERIELLQGLIDTDGSVIKKGSVRFYSSNKALALGVQQLVWGLGGTALLSSRERLSYFTGRPITPYELRIRLPEGIAPCKLERKLERYVPHVPYRAIASVEQVADEETLCISVDSKRRIYVTDDYVVTSNTTLNLNRIFAWGAGRSLFPGWTDKDGQEYLKPSHPLRTLIAENEGNAGMFHQKMGKMLYESDLTEQEKQLCLDNLFVHGDGGYSGLKLDNDDGLRKLRAAVEFSQPDILFIEPFRSLWRGEENSSTDMNIVIDNLIALATDYDCAIILSHHERKSGAGEDGEKMSAGRGSTVLEGAVALMENFESVMDGKYREMTWSKARYLPPPTTVRMEYNVDTSWYDWVPMSAIDDGVLVALREADDEPLNLVGLVEATGESKSKLRPIMKRLEDEKRIKKMKSVSDQNGSTGTRWRLPSADNSEYGGLTV